MKVLGNIVFWATLISPMISFSLASMIGESEIFGVAGIVRYSWVMWLFIPPGIISLIVGKKLKQGKERYKKNYIIALICVPLLLIFGSYRFVFNSVSYDINKVNVVEETTNLRLPRNVKIATLEFESYDLSYLKITEKQERDHFEQDLRTSSVWETELSTKIKTLLPFDVQAEMHNFDYFLLYNIVENTYNAYPSDGECDCIFIAYNCEKGRLIILDNFIINLT